MTQEIYVLLLCACIRPSQLAKYTDNGSSATFQWSQVGGGSGADVGSGVDVSTPADGSAPRVYVSGYITNTSASSNASAVLFGGTGTTLGNNAQLGASSTNSNDLLLAKYPDNGPTGAFQWSQVGGSGNDQDPGMVMRGQLMFLASTVVPVATFGPTTIANSPGGTLGVLV